MRIVRQAEQSVRVGRERGVNWRAQSAIVRCTCGARCRVGFSRPVRDSRWSLLRQPWCSPGTSGFCWSGPACRPGRPRRRRGRRCLEPRAIGGDASSRACPARFRLPGRAKRMRSPLAGTIACSCGARPRDASTCGFTDNAVHPLFAVHPLLLCTRAASETVRNHARLADARATSRRSASNPRRWRPNGAARTAAMRRVVIQKSDRCGTE